MVITTTTRSFVEHLNEGKRFNFLFTIVLHFLLLQDFATFCITHNELPTDGKRERWRIYL